MNHQLVPFDTRKAEVRKLLLTRLAEANAHRSARPLTRCSIATLQLKLQAIGDVDVSVPAITVDRSVRWCLANQSHHLLRVVGWNEQASGDAYKYIISHFIAFVKPYIYRLTPYIAQLVWFDSLFLAKRRILKSNKPKKKVLYGTNRSLRKDPTGTRIS